VKKALIIILTFCTALAFAQQKRQVAVLPAVADANALDPQGLILLTDKVREIASKNLPMKDFLLLKQDVITNRLGGDEELYNACKEGVCIAELTKRISADYGARCDIMKRGDDLAMKFELYSVRDEAILETFTKYPTKDLFEMLAELEARLPDAFRKMVNMSKEQQDAITQKSEPKSEPKPEPYIPPPPKPDTVKTYTVTVNASPSNGGTVSRNPDYDHYKEGTAVTVSAQPSIGYTFAGWGGAQTSKDDKITITMNENKTLTAQFQRIEQPKSEEQQRQEAEQKRKLKKNKALGTAIAFDIVGAGLVSYGLYENTHAKKQTDDNTKKIFVNRDLTGAEKSVAIRNAVYIIGGALLAAGVSIHIIF